MIVNEISNTVIIRQDIQIKLYEYSSTGLVDKITLSEEFWKIVFTDNGEGMIMPHLDTSIAIGRRMYRSSELHEDIHL